MMLSTGERANAGVPSRRGGRLRNMLCVLVLWLVFYIAYFEVVAPNYWYLDMGIVDFDGSALILNLFTLLVGSLVLPVDVRRSSSFVIWMLFILVAISGSFIPLVSGRLDAAESWAVTALACGALAVISIINIPDPRPLRKPTITPRSYLHLLLAAALMVNVSVFVFTGFSLAMPGIDEIYDARLEFRQVLDTLPAFVGYAIPLAANVLNPLLLVVSVRLRNYWIVATAVVLQAGLFSIDGQKMVLLLPAVVVVIYIFTRARNAVSASLLVCAFATMAAIATVSTSVIGRVMFEVTVRRLAMIPGQLLGAYFDYFGNFGFAYLQHSRFFNSSVLSPEPGYIIGQYVFGSTVQNANASIIGDGFANFGVLGVLINAVICALLLKVMDMCTAGAPLPVRLAVSVSPAIILSNNAMLTALLTSGLFALLVLLYVMPSFTERTPDLQGRARKNIAREQREVPSY